MEIAWLHDAMGEFKKLSPMGKTAVIGAFLLAGGIGFYEYRKSQSGTTASSVAGTPQNTSQGGIGGLSALDTQSLANMIAGLVNNQQGTTTPPPPNNNPGGTTTPPNFLDDLIGKIAPGSKINPGGNSKAFPGFQRFWYGNHQLFYAPIGTKFTTGANGQVFYTLPDGKPQPFSKTGGGGPDVMIRQYTVQAYDLNENGHMVYKKYKA